MSKKFFMWSREEYGLDVKDMGDEHKVLIDKMNALHEAWVNIANKDSLLMLANDLGSYTEKHFADEEAYMTEIKYNGIETHKIIHKKLLASFKSHVDSLKAKGNLDENFFAFLKTWLASHIRGIDMKYAKGKTAFNVA